jgi:hypothetical protein
VLGQQRQDLTEACCVITDTDRSHHNTGLVDQGHVMMILSPIDTARYRYHPLIPSS